MSRKFQRQAATSWQRTNLGRNGYMPAERFAAVALECERCGHQLMVFRRHMDEDGALEYAGDSGTLMTAGPEDDPFARLAFDCEGCQRVDILVRRDRLEQLTADLLAKCQIDDTPRTIHLKS